MLSVDAERMKFSRWYIDISFSDHFVVLMHFQVASLAVEVPARAPLERRGNHRLRWVKFNKFAIHVNPGRTEDSTFVHSKEICICNHAAPVHFEFEKLIAIDVLCSGDAVQHREANFPTSVWFYIGNTKSSAQFFCHVVAPSRPGCGGNKRSGQRGCRQKCGSKENVPKLRALATASSPSQRPTNVREWIRLWRTTVSVYSAGGHKHAS